MCRRVLASCCALYVFASLVTGQTKAPEKTPPLPKIVLIGDSIRMAYAPLVAKRLEGKAVVVSGKANGGDSANVLKNLEAWVLREQPDIVHVNAGLHDLKLDRTKKTYQVELAQYEANLKEIVARIRKETKATIIFANTTPIHDERHAKRGGFDRTEADVQRYNAAAVALMKAEGIAVNDLHGLVIHDGMETMLGSDGTHYTPAGNEKLAEAVADVLQRQLIVAAAKPLAKTESDAKAAAAYRKAEAERDSKVPPYFKKLPVGTLALPASAADWKAQRPELLKIAVQSLGDLPPRPSPLQVRLVSRELRRDYTLEHVAYDNGVGSEIGALVLVPVKAKKPAPAILWLHSSTPNKAQIVTPNTNGGAEPLGETFVHAGYVVMAPDAYWYGERAGTGPSGPLETDRVEQESLHKFHLWMGRTLWGMFVRDDQIALDYLCSRPEVDKTRIGATGMSMGSTRSWWLAAIDERVAATVGVACLTRYQNLLAHGQLRAHGVYYFNYGMLKHFDTEGVIALIAPRPYLALTGDLDAGSPADGIKIIEEKAGAVYKTLGAAEHFKSILYKDIGHSYTPEMRREMLAWFALSL